MKYRVFVSSTIKDLMKQRQQVIRRLREANLDVVAMEDGTAAPEHPADWSVKQLSNADFCVAIVAFQRGTLATNDPGRRSITQIEIDEARRRKIPLLVYLLRDTPENRAAWPQEHNRLEDADVENWRRYLSTECTCTFFNADEIPDPLPAISRQVCSLEQSKTRRVRIQLAVVLTSVLTFITSLLSPTVQGWMLNRMLGIRDPQLFQQSPDGKYRIARLLDGASEIRATNFAETIRGSQREFSMFANTFVSFRDHLNDFREAAGRGVRLRFIVTDFSDLNRTNWVPFHEAIADTAAYDFNETLTAARNVRAVMRELCTEYPDLVEIRLNAQPIFFTLWVRDPGESGGLAHLGIHYYHSQRADWPAFRVSAETSGGQLMKLRDQFEILWNDSIKDAFADL